MKVTLGIDTSNYTTSVAAVCGAEVVFDQRRMLRVPEGGRGLRQSEAFYQHVLQLPVLMERLFHVVDPQDVSGIGVSTRPRPVEGSYMPVFAAGESLARTAAAALGKTIFATTHQQGHIAAGLFSGAHGFGDSFLAVHVSGGTTDLMRVQRQGAGIMPQLIGGSNDLNAGQFIDRVGVALGLAFPAGRQLEQLAAEGTGTQIIIKSSVKDLNCSFSGAESAAQRLIAGGAAPAEVAFATQKCIMKTLVKLIRGGVAATGIQEVLAVGGVLSNQYLRQELTRQLEKESIKIFYASAQLSADNAVGVAALAQGRQL
ncbi:MAG: O-sialoglycoprotein endopeptidase [Eubacteriales bacterium]|nr:O-sialoglycoprotein endopeptidase [Eubacteriales bacterium]